MIINQILGQCEQHSDNHIKYLYLSQSLGDGAG